MSSINKAKKKRLNKAFHAAYWNLIIGSIGIISTAILTVIRSRFVTGNITYEQSELRSSVVQNAGVALLVASFPLLLDICMNIYYCPTIFKYGNGIIVGRLFYAIGTFLFSLEITLQINIFSSYEQSAWFMLSSYRIITLSSMMFFIAITDLTHKVIFQTIVFSALSSLVSCCYACKLELLSGIIGLFLLYGLIFFIQQNFKIWKYLSSKRHQVTAYAQFLYVNLFLFAFSTGFFVRVYFYIFSTGEGSISRTYETFPMLSMYVYVINTIILIVIPGWINRKVALHSTKLVPE